MEKLHFQENGKAEFGEIQQGKRPVHIAFISGREISYPRNESINRALGQFATVSVLSSTHPRLIYRLAKVAGSVISASPHDWNQCFVGFFGQPLVFATRLRWRGPLILDAFLSTYDTLCFDRKLFKPQSFRGRLAYYLDLYSCQLADMVVLDTLAHISYFEETFHVPRKKMRVLYVGCDDSLFRPLNVQEADIPTVLFYGSFAPLQGIEIIIRAAHQLSAQKVRFQIIGQGQESERIHRLAKTLGITNVEFLKPVPLTHLPEIIAHATICLGGHFGSSAKAHRVIAGKTFQCLACAKPTIVGDNPANRELFTHGQDTWMCEMNNPAALANAIQHLLDSPQPRKQIGANARQTILDTCGNEMTWRALKNIVEEAISIHRDSPRIVS